VFLCIERKRCSFVCGISLSEVSQIPDVHEGQEVSLPRQNLASTGASVPTGALPLYFKKAPCLMKRASC